MLQRRQVKRGCRWHIAGILCVTTAVGAVVLLLGQSKVASILQLTQEASVVRRASVRVTAEVYGTKLALEPDTTVGVMELTAVGPGAPQWVGRWRQWVPVVVTSHSWRIVPLRPGEFADASVSPEDPEAFAAMASKSANIDGSGVPVDMWEAFRRQRANAYDVAGPVAARVGAVLFGAILACTSLLFGMRWRTSWAKERRLVLGHCLACNYPLREVSGGSCPECGAPNGLLSAPGYQGQEAGGERTSVPIEPTGPRRGRL